MSASVEPLSEAAGTATISAKLCYIAICIGIAIRVGFFFFATNNGGDALARAAVTADWISHPSLTLELGGPHWLPIHFWMMAALSIVVHSVTIGTRLLSLLFGAFSVWAVWRLARDQYGIHSALLSLVIFGLYTLHIGYSTTSSSEVTYLGLILAALLCLFAYRRTGDLLVLGCAGILLTISAGVRYEAWVFILLVGTLLVLKSSDGPFLSKQHAMSIVVFACTAGIWPVFWMIVQWRLNGDALFGIHHNEGAIAGQLAINPAHAGVYQLLLVPGVLLLTLTPLALIGAAYAVFLAVRRPLGRELAIIAVGFILIQFRTLATGGILAGARYTLTDGVLISILAGYGLYRIAQKFPLRSYHVLLGGTAIVMVANLIVITTLSAEPNRLMDKFRSISPLLQYPQHIEEIARFLGPRLKASDAIVIDNYNEESNIIAAAIGLPLLRGNRAFLASEADPRGVLGYMKEYQPQYVIMADLDDNLAPYLVLPSGCPNNVSIDGYEFSCIFQEKMYRLYAISYPMVRQRVVASLTEIKNRN